MAASHLPLIFSLFPLIFIVANARPGFQFYPCKTLLISYTISSSSSSSSSNQNPSEFFTIYREISQLGAKPLYPSSDLLIDRSEIPQPFRFGRSFEGIPKSDNPHRVPLRRSSLDSLRERTKDILSVVVALLFGVGCGALTSATMYLAWSLITNRYESRDYEEGSDDDVSPKKNGYVKIPAAAAATAPVKEGYEGN